MESIRTVRALTSRTSTTTGLPAAAGLTATNRRTDVSPMAVDVCGDGIDQDCSGSDQVCGDIDADQDGFSPNAGDCNDDDASINPGATENRLQRRRRRLRPGYP